MIIDVFLYVLLGFFACVTLLSFFVHFLTVTQFKTSSRNVPHVLESREQKLERENKFLKDALARSQQETMRQGAYR